MSAPSGPVIVTVVEVSKVALPVIVGSLTAVGSAFPIVTTILVART